MVGLPTLDRPIGVRIPALQPDSVPHVEEPERASVPRSFFYSQKIVGAVSGAGASALTYQSNIFDSLVRHFMSIGEQLSLQIFLAQNPLKPRGQSQAAISGWPHSKINEYF